MRLILIRGLELTDNLRLITPHPFFLISRQNASKELHILKNPLKVYLLGSVRLFEFDVCELDLKNNSSMSEHVMFHS